MVYIYKKVIGGRAYYYLRISKRIGGKLIVKDIAYLGNDVSKIRSKLDSLPTKYNKEIRKAYLNINRYIQSNFYLEEARSLKLKSNNYLEKELLQQIEAIRLHFNRHFLKLDKSIARDALEDFLIDFAFNTASIEGNTITLEEANKLLRENLTPKDRTLREIYDLQNTKTVFFELLDSKPSIDSEEIATIHDNLLKNIDQRRGYRMHDIRVFKSRFDATPFPYIKTDMDILLKWFEENKDKLHPLVLVGIFHQKFEKIHPFSDGNGRTGRMLMNYILLQNKYPPIIIPKVRRADYLDALEEADKAGLREIEPKYYSSLIKYLAEELIESYWKNFNI